MRQPFYQTIWGLLLVIASALIVSASPAVFSLKSACVDGFCIEIEGKDLLNAGPATKEPERRDSATYINIYHSDNTSAPISRVYRHQFINEFSENDEDYLVFDLPEAFLEKIFINHGILIEVVNPGLVEAEIRTSEKHYVFWRQNPVITCEKFDDRRVGNYRLGHIKKDFFSNSKSRGWLRSVAAEEASIRSDAEAIPGEEAGNNVLSIVNRKGRWGPLGAASGGGRTGGGLTFNALICASGDCDHEGPASSFTTAKGFEELFMSYWIRFEGLDGGDFDFRRGGKLPGFAGGQISVASGGGHKGILPDGRNGWSARATFAADGRGYQYLYYPDNSNPVVGAGKKYGENRPWMAQGQPFQFSSNRWYRILQRIKMNSVDQASGLGREDGLIQVWVNNDLVLDDRVRFRHSPSGTPTPGAPPFHMGKLLDIDTIAMGLFHGGGTPGHAPAKDVRWILDDFIVFGPLTWTSDHGCKD